MEASKQSLQLRGPTLTLPVHGKASQTCRCKYRKFEAQLRQDECLATEVELNISLQSQNTCGVVSGDSYAKHTASC